MPGIWALEWLNANSQRNYPLTDDATGIDTTGSFVLPTDFLVSLDLPLSTGVDADPSRFFLYQLGAYATGYIVIIGYQPPTGYPIQVASASIPTAGFVENQTYALGGIGDYADTVGKVTINSLGNIGSQPGGFFTFTLATARIEPDCVRPIIRGVSSIIVTNGNNQSVRLTGDIELIADSNMQLTTSIVAGQNPQIMFSAIQGEGLAQPCVCAGDTVANPITRFNGVAPTPSGDFTIVGDNCLKITPIANGLQFTDACSQPCCGCAELEAITQDLQQLSANAATLQGFVGRVSTSVDTFANTVLSSTLSDVGCG